MSTHYEPLPDLPRQVKKREADVTPKILDWFLHKHWGSCAIEIKATNGNSIPASALEPHQQRALLDALDHGIVHKIADSGRRLPFDAFVLKGVPAYVVACFTSHGKAYVVPVDKWKGGRWHKTPGAEYMIVL